MAVMTTTLSNDGVVLEQKTQPVPSSEKMALDLDINGTSKRDETNLEFEIPKPSVIPNFDSSPTFLDTSEIHKRQNNEATAANDRITENIVPNIIEENHSSIQPTSTIVADRLGGEGENLKTTTKTTITTTSATITETPPTDNSQADSSFDTTATTTVPPLVGSQESDLRESTLPVSQIKAAEIHAVKHTMDLHADPELANGLENTAGNDVIERENSTSNEALDQAINGEGAGPNNISPQVGSATIKETDRIEDNESSENAIHSTGAPSLIEGDSHKTHNIENLQIDSTSQIAEEPAEQPIDQPIEQPAEPSTSTESAADVQMSEAENPKPDVDMEDLFGESAPQSSGNKVARERDEDIDMDAPEAKRIKVDTGVNGDAGVKEEAGEDGDSRPITPEILKVLKAGIAGAKKGKISESFRRPVCEAWPNLAESYIQRIEKPMDISVLEKNLVEGQYQTIGDYKADLKLIYSNSLEYNGIEHGVTGAAERLQTYLMNKIPPVDYVPPAPKSKPSRKSTPNLDFAARRPSRNANPASPPVAKVKAETFPLDPVSQTPVIRRDSAFGDNGRPKREIHPPKPKDIFTEAAPTKPNRKKHALELKFCEELLQDVMSTKNKGMNQIFMHPVDVVALGIPHYLKEIKKPMDLSEIHRRLSNGHYLNAAAFESDFRLMLANCFQFNPPDNPVHQKGRDLEKYFNNEWNTKTRWMTANAPARERQPSPDFEEEQSDEGEEEAPSSNEVPIEDRNPISDKLVEEQDKLIQMATNGATPQMMALQTQIVDMCKAQLKELDNKIAAAKKRNTKKAKAPPKPAKRAPAPAASTKKPKKQKARYIGHTEKEIISQGIGQLNEKEMQIVINWIRSDVPGLENVDDNEMELDIDAVSAPCLNRLYDLVLKHVPHILDTFVPSQPEAPRAAPAPKPKKKNKPMGKSEQESKIAHLKQVVGQSTAPTSGNSSIGGGQRYDDSTGAIEQEESSGDEEDSDSEEE